MMLATVTQVSPLLVRVDGAATATAARLVGGVAFTATVGARVLVAQVSGRLYVLGGA